MFAKPECDNVLQPKPPSDEGCNDMRAWANVKTQEKNVISSLLYTFSKSNTFETRASVYKTLCPQHKLAPNTNLDILKSHVIFKH